jgi:hypothetical protein
MNATVQDAIHDLHVVGVNRTPIPVVLAAPRSYRIRGELVTLPHVVGTARTTVYRAPVARTEQVAAAA